MWLCTYEGLTGCSCADRMPDSYIGGKTHGIVLLNSNAMDVVLTKNRVQWRVVGGLLDFYFLMGPTPNKVMEQLTSIIGRPVMPPYWSMGLMQSK